MRNLGFVGDAYRGLESVPYRDLRVGMLFAGAPAAFLHRALKDAAATIERMPATYISYPNGGPVFPVTRSGRMRRPDRLRLDQAYLLSFGEMLIPRHLWTTLRRFDVWIEPAIVAEWSKLIRDYASGQNRKVANSSIRCRDDLGRSET